MKLNPEALVVTSFPTSNPLPDPEAEAISTPACPTPATICFICPPITYNCA
jgi:hypothetical protein